MNGYRRQSQLSEVNRTIIGAPRLSQFDPEQTSVADPTAFVALHPRRMPKLNYVNAAGYGLT